MFKIYNDLESLAALAKQIGGDDDISRKIHEFYGEVLMNFLMSYKDSYDKICSVVKVPALPPQKQPELQEAVDKGPLVAASADPVAASGK